MTHGREFDIPGHYQIRVRGILDPKWADWLDNLVLTVGEDETTLTSQVQDQAALYALLLKIQSLGLPLLSVERVLPDEDSKA